METTALHRPGAAPLSLHLKEDTRATHERLDTAIMAARPFDSIQNYGHFLRMQFVLHRDVAALYEHPELVRFFPYLGDLPRFEAVKLDLADLKIDEPAYPDFSLRTQVPDLATAVGWLYVIEGSNLGAAVLLKAARKLDLSETWGARHLAPASEGRAVHWRQFKESLDAVDMDRADQERAVHGANEAFLHARALAQFFL
ncbi:MAG: biliverdin-producing heme oxygenase [Pseudomonadota bacterium]